MFRVVGGQLSSTRTAVTLSPLFSTAVTISTVRTSTDLRRRRVDHIARFGGLSRLRVDENDTVAELRAMMRASIRKSALQGIAGKRRANLSVVGGGIGHLAGQVLGVQDATRILNGGQERLQIDVEADAPSPPP